METLTPPTDLTMLRTWMANNLGVAEKAPIHRTLNIPYMIIPMFKKSDLIAYWHTCEKVVCEHIGIEETDLKEKLRTKNVVEARQIIWHLVHTEFKDRVTLKMLGERYGKDHATALHGLKCVNNYLKIGRAFKSMYHQIKIKLAI
jgi:hypothetical protein